MKILIVGGGGYLGGALTDLLIQSTHTMRVYDLLLYEESYRKKVPLIHGDVRDVERLQPLLDWADVVVWLAALVGDPACALNEKLTRDVNVKSIEYLVSHYRGRIIFMSSCSVYGASDGLLTEDSVVNPLSLYARTKLEAEHILQQSPAIIFRLGTLFGVGDPFSRIRFDLVVNTLTMRAAIHKTINVFGGEQYRPLLHVRDAAQAVAQAIEQSQTGVYNLHGENTTIRQVADRVCSFFPDVTTQLSQTKFQDNRNYKVSSEKAQNDLGFASVYTIDQGINELKQLLEEGRVKNSFITRFSNYLYLKPLLTEYQSPLGRVVKMNI